MCFSVNFEKFLRPPIMRKISDQLLQTIVIEKMSAKISQSVKNDYCILAGDDKVKNSLQLRQIIN